MKTKRELKKRIKELEEEHTKEMANNLGLLFENAKLKLDNEGLKLYRKDLESYIENDNSKGKDTP